jgi:hypothetical protein
MRKVLEKRELSHVISSDYQHVAIFANTRCHGMVKRALRLYLTNINPLKTPPPRRQQPRKESNRTG